MPTILVTGFGPFPGAPVNPTEPLVEDLEHVRLPGTRIATHVFQTSYAAIDRQLPLLLMRHRPGALLMFGLAAATPHLRIETWARNAVAELPDAGGVTPASRSIAPGRAPRLKLPTLDRTLLAAARRAGVAAAVSEDAGDYLCNYLCWRTALIAGQPGGPRLAAFIHVPENLPAADLARAGRGFLQAIAPRLSRNRS